MSEIRKNTSFSPRLSHSPMRRLRAALSVAAVVAAAAASAMNPYLPLWEHIPDGEPYVFEDPDNPGKQRVYIFGSHDMLKWMYCGLDQVVWSARSTRLKTGASTG